MMFLDCPACLDQHGAARCGLPAEVSCRFTMRSTDGPLDSIMIRCPAGHHFSGPVPCLTPDRTGNPDQGTATASSRAERNSHHPPMKATAAAAADRPSAITAPRHRGKITAGTTLPPTTSANRPPYGSPPCARAAAAHNPYPGAPAEHR